MKRLIKDHPEEIALVISLFTISISFFTLGFSVRGLLS